ncbi:DUF5060 domain-containing protein [Aurantibacter sp.]|uniref:DUF5060 domain-containing protein n=1 Tax=Aurantibacter sp. TaxID=2807103 RepID=UPI003263BCA0
MHILKRLYIIFLLTALSCKTENKKVDVVEYPQYHTITLDFEGPETSEDADDNPFLNYRLTVNFKSENGEYNLRGFYAADGNAAESSANSGKVWRVRFNPEEKGDWTYSAKLEKGDSIALSDTSIAGETLSITNNTGDFKVIASDKTGKDFRANGRLVNDNEYFRFKDSGKYWIKGGADSPENLLGYEDFDGTYRMQSSSADGEAKTNDTLHRYEPHLKDWKTGNPTWKNGKGKGLIGALNYLASKNMNVVYFLVNNINGDGKDVWPYVRPDDFTRFDVSKLAQWEVVFEYMQAKGILLHMVLQETENETMLDNGDTGPMRQLYLQELVARFGHHLGMNFNLGEENGFAEFTPISQYDAQRRAMTSFIKKIDPFDHPVLLHTHSHEPARGDILDSIVGFKDLDGISLQVDKREGVAEVVTEWKQKAHEAGHDWMITMDEIGMWHTGARSDSLDGNHDSLRRYVLWGSLLSGAAGVEWYFGANNKYHDLNTEDWRTRDRLWEITDIGLNFFNNHIPYWEMTPEPTLINSKEAYCLKKSGEFYAVYIPDSEEYTINLTGVEGVFSIKWYDPLNGGDFQKGSVASMVAGSEQSMGSPPDTGNSQDWIVLIEKKEE